MNEIIETEISNINVCGLTQNVTNSGVVSCFGGCEKRSFNGEDIYVWGFDTKELKNITDPNFKVKAVIWSDGRILPLDTIVSFKHVYKESPESNPIKKMITITTATTAKGDKIESSSSWTGSKSVAKEKGRSYNKIYLKNIYGSIAN